MSLIEDQIRLHRSWLSAGMERMHGNKTGSWASVHLNPCHASPAAAEVAINGMYHNAGFDPPGKIIRCGSPLALEKMREAAIATVETGGRSFVLEEAAGVFEKIMEKIPINQSESVLNLYQSAKQHLHDTRAEFWRAMSKRRPLVNIAGSVHEEVFLPIKAVDARFPVEQIRREASSALGNPEKLLPRSSAWLALARIRLMAGAASILLAKAEKMVPNAFEQVSPWVLPLPDVCIVSERPVRELRNARDRLHSLIEPALVYPDGFALYAINGVFMPEHVALHPQHITLDEIGTEANAEARRILIERFGMPRYLLESGAEIIHRDGAGILYRKQVMGDEPIVMIRVLNATPEPDGVLSRSEAIETFSQAAGAALNAPADARFKEYMLRVPPAMKTARDAVAWTFGLEGEEYHPAIES